MHQKAGNIARIGQNRVGGEIAVEPEVPEVILQEGGERATELILIASNERCSTSVLIGACHVPTFNLRRVRDKPPLRVTSGSTVALRREPDFRSGCWRPQNRWPSAAHHPVGRTRDARQDQSCR